MVVLSITIYFRFKRDVKKLPLISSISFCVRADGKSDEYILSRNSLATYIVSKVLYTHIHVCMYVCVYLTKLHFLRKIIFPIILYLKCISISSIPIAYDPCRYITIHFFIPIKIAQALIPSAISHKFNFSVNYT